ATTTNKILPAQSPTPCGQMATHDQHLFVVHLQKLRRHNDCLAALGLNEDAKKPLPFFCVYF
ncbi:hypothetical protein, partial [Prosthecobacter sp.]|uniref:hypothetical protein n=1 Tax=Prosthecobacter sp. TaxID=1965333 RepID=UPI0037840C92